MEILEREQQLGVLRTLLAEAAEGRGKLVALTGEAGVGKTTLIEAFIAASGCDPRVLRGACEDLSTPEPLAPLVDLARDASWNFAETLSENRQRLSLFSEALSVFDLPDLLTLIVIEDLHWADEATLDFVRYLGRRVRNLRVLALVTARNEEVEAKHRVRRALTDIPLGNLVRIEVPPLSRRAVDQLARPTRADGASVYDATAGNAFFVAETLRADQAGALPLSVSDAVLARVERLPERARRVLEAVSVFPRRVEAEVLEELLGSDFASDIEECIARALLVRTTDGYAFRHELARRAVEQNLANTIRRELNVRALRCLREREAPVARLLHHALGAEDRMSVGVLAPIAGREAARAGAHREAARHFRTALEQAESYSEEERVRLLEDASLELHFVGKHDEAIQARTEALALLERRGDRLRAGNALRWLSRFNYTAGRRDAAVVQAEQAVERLEGSGDPELAMAYSSLAQVAMLGYETERALAYGCKAVELAEQLGRADIVCHALNNMGHALTWTNWSKGLGLLERSLAMALRDRLHYDVTRAYTNMAGTMISRHLFHEAEEKLEAGIAYAAEHQIDFMATYMRGELASVYLRTGRWSEAEKEAEAASATGLILGPATFVVLVPLADIQMRTGRGDVAGLLAEMCRYFENGKELQRYRRYARLVAQRAWIEDRDRHLALDLIAEVQAAAPSPLMVEELIPWRRLLSPTVPEEDPTELSEPYRRLVTGDWAGAADAWAEIGAPFDRALALLEGGPDALRGALEIFKSLGADAVVHRVREMMKGRGIRVTHVGPRAATTANPAGLTKRQMDVLRMLDQGASNGEISEKLFISAKTVDHHVSAILAKLNARSRGEAAAVARRVGLL